MATSVLNAEGWSKPVRMILAARLMNRLGICLLTWMGNQRARPSAAALSRQTNNPNLHHEAQLVHDVPVL